LTIAGLLFKQEATFSYVFPGLFMFTMERSAKTPSENQKYGGVDGTGLMEC
jgi:hypothetical protein